MFRRIERDIYLCAIIMKIKTRYGIIKKKRNIMKKRKKLNFIENKKINSKSKRRKKENYAS